MRTFSTEVDRPETGPKAGPMGSRTPPTSDVFGGRDTGLGPDRKQKHGFHRAPEGHRNVPVSPLDGQRAGAASFPRRLLTDAAHVPLCPFRYGLPASLKWLQSHLNGVLR